MTIEKALNTPWIGFYIRGTAERDPGFKRVIMRLTKAGMTVAGLLAVSGVAVYIMSYVLRGMSIGMDFEAPRAAVLWDELVILVVSSAVLLLSRTQFGQRRGRTLVSLLAVITSAAVLAEDTAGGDFTFSSAYLSLVLIVAVGTMPFRPVQTLILGLIVSTGYAFVMAYPPMASRSGLFESRLVFMIVLTITLCGISAVVYTSRYRQYQALKELSRAQARLVQSEKMASLGQLTAGIAHEIKNPLNFINNFAELNLDHVRSLESLLGDAGRDARDVDDVLDYLRINSEKICQQGRRADAIVRAMMLHARGTPGDRRWTDLNSLVDEYVNLAYYGTRATLPSVSIRIDRDYDQDVGEVEIVAQDLARVIINLLNNAFDAVHEKASHDNDHYEGVVGVTTRRLGDEVAIRIRDNGAGIPGDVTSRIFDPFFTTKPAGMGTGLGLSMSYDIVVQEHGGRLEVESRRREGSEFTVFLPAEPAARSVRRRTATS